MAGRMSEHIRFRVKDGGELKRLEDRIALLRENFVIEGEAGFLWAEEGLKLSDDERPATVLLLPERPGYVTRVNAFSGKPEARITDCTPEACIFFVGENGYRLEYKAREK